MMSYVGSAAPIAAFVGVDRRRADRIRTACGRSRAEDGGPRLSCLARNAGFSRQGKKAEGSPLRDRAACRPIAPLEGRGALSSDLRDIDATDHEAIRRARPYPVAAVTRVRERTTSCGASCRRTDVLTLQLLYREVSESMGNHDSEIVDAGSVD